MKLADLDNLYIATNKDEDFSVCVCARDEIDATEIAIGYFKDTDFDKFDNLYLRAVKDGDNFDCDYVITY